LFKLPTCWNILKFYRGLEWTLIPEKNPKTNYKDRYLEWHWSMWRLNDFVDLSDVLQIWHSIDLSFDVLEGFFIVGIVLKLSTLFVRRLSMLFVLKLSMLFGFNLESSWLIILAVKSFRLTISSFSLTGFCFVKDWKRKENNQIKNFQWSWEFGREPFYTSQGPTVFIVKFNRCFRRLEWKIKTVI